MAVLTSRPPAPSRLSGWISIAPRRPGGLSPRWHFSASPGQGEPASRNRIQSLAAPAAAALSSANDGAAPVSIASSPVVSGTMLPAPCITTLTPGRVIGPPGCDIRSSPHGSTGPSHPARQRDHPRTQRRGHPCGDPRRTCCSGDRRAIRGDRPGQRLDRRDGRGRRERRSRPNRDPESARRRPRSGPERRRRFGQDGVACLHRRRLRANAGLAARGPACRPGRGRRPGSGLGPTLPKRSCLSTTPSGSSGNPACSRPPTSSSRVEWFERVGGFEDIRPTAAARPFGEDAWLGWRLVRAGARAKFAANALVHHAVLPRPWSEFVAERRRLAYFPMLAARIPELRDRFFMKVFLTRRTAAFDGAVLAGISALAFSSPIPLIGVAPYLYLVVRDAAGWRHLALGVAAAGVASDAVGLGALAWGSLRQRTILL